MRTERAALELLTERVASTFDQCGERFPYYADPETGEWVTTAGGNWCGGHWVHMLWMAHDVTGEDRFKTAAERNVGIVAENMPRDSMFCGMNFLHAGFKSHGVSGDAREFDLGIEGADAMVAYYHEQVKQIPIGTLTVHVPEGIEGFRGPGDDLDGETTGATDSIHAAVSVLWRAYEETENPDYRDVATKHADRHVEWYVKADGSTWNVVHFDRETGELLDQFNDLAYSNDTCWARGQGWTILGFADAYRATGEDRYLETLRELVEFYRANTPADLVPHWDFEHPEKPDVPRDTSSAAIAANGLTSLPETDQTSDLRDTGEDIVQSLIEDYLTPTHDGDDRPHGMTLHGCYDGPEDFATDNELLWTNYYLMDALYQRRRTTA